MSNRAGGLEGGITNGEGLRVRGYLKPISTLKKPLRSVDIDTKLEDLAAFERSDVDGCSGGGCYRGSNADNYFSQFNA